MEDKIEKFLLSRKTDKEKTSVRFFVGIKNTIKNYCMSFPRRRESSIKTFVTRFRVKPGMTKVFGMTKKRYYEWKTRRRIRRGIRESYTDLFIPLSLAAKKYSYFFSPREKVTKRALKPRLGLRRILTSLTENPNSLREDRADFRPLVSAESVAEPYARLKNFNKIAKTLNSLEIINYLKICLPTGKVQKLKIKNSTLKRAVAVVTILIVIANVYVQNSNYSSGATFTFDQSQWRATPTGGNAAHPGDQSSFTDYTSKDANISLTGGAGPYNSATLSTSSDSETQTVDADFNAGTTSQTAVGGDSVSLAPEPGGFGDGGDGAWTISSAKNINTDTNGNGGRTCADGISYNVTALTANTATLSGTPPAGCYSAGDQVMLLNEQGDGENLTNVGNYEFLEVESISDNLITFTSNKTKYYGNGASDDTNIGTTAGDSWTAFDPADTPSAMGAGAASTYPGFGDYIYAFRGLGYPDFWAYSISNNNWTTFDPTDAPDSVNAGSSLVYPGSGDYIYAFRGNYFDDFWAYSIANNNWTTFDPTDPPLVAGNGGSLLYPGSGDYIYAFTGDDSATFLAYSLTNNNWTTFDPTDAPMAVDEGASLIYPGSGDYIYALRGSSSNYFWAYSIAHNNWTTFDPTDAPSFVRGGGSLVYPGSGDYIYAVRGNSQTPFWAYSISNNNWTTFDPTDPPVTIGGTTSGASQLLVYPDSGDYIYALRGNNSNFLAYSLKRQRVVLQRIPQYTDVTIQSGGSLTANAWDGTKGGVLAFYASGTVDVQSGGSIDVSGKGFRGGSGSGCNTAGTQGESYNSVGRGSAIRNLGGGGGGIDDCLYWGTGGGSGGYGTVGNPGDGIEGGATYGESTLAQLFLGSGGGGGWNYDEGGDGGGIIYILGNEIFLNASVSSNGSNGIAISYSESGAGSGGSVYLIGNTLSLGTDNATATGGLLNPTGGDGRIHLKSNSISGTTDPVADTSSLPTTYYSSGTFTSEAIDTGQNTSAWGNFTWNATLNGQVLTIKARTDADGNFSDATAWGSCSNITSGQALSTGGCATNGHRYVQYQATLSGDTTATPSLDDVTIGYSYYPTGQTVISSWYNTTDSANLLSKVIWDENSTLPSGTTIQFQAQTAPDSAGTPGTATGWQGPDGTTGTYFSNSDGNCSKPALSQTVTCNVPASTDIGDGTDDQWIQYKVFLNSDGANAPQLDSAKLQYVVNGSPTVTNVTASENSSGVLNIAYDVDDVDNATQTISFGIDTGVTLADNPLTSGATTINLSGNYSNLLTSSQTIQIDQEQMTCATRAGATLSTCTRAANNTRASTHTQNSIVWFVSTAGNVSGDAGAGIANGTGKSATWNIKSDLNSVYNAAAAVRVLANDGQLANQMSLATGAVSATFALDTKNPTSPQITFDRSASADQITIGITDDSMSGLQYALNFPNAATDGSSDPCDFTTPSWQSFTYPSQTVNISDNNDDVRKACVLFRDAYGNTSSNVANFALTPQNPYAFQYYDVSNVGIGDYRLFLSWGVPEDTAEGKESGANGFSQYEVQRCSDSKDNENCTPIATYETIVSKLENSLTDTESGAGLDPDLRYCYRYRIKDGNPDPTNDYSKWSSTICAVPGSGTSSITKNVSIHWYDTAEENVPADQVYTTQATIKWQTVNAADPGEAILSDSTVWWRVLGSSEWTESYSVSSYVEDHIITIPGRLSPGTTYEYRVTSTTPWAASDTQNGTTPATFTTKLGPVIRNVQTVSVGNTNAAVEWDTEDQSGDPANASSIVYYSVALDSNGDLVAPQTGNCPGGYSSHHACTMTDLTSGLPYYYYVYSVLETDPDAYSADTNGGEFYRFTTTTDTTPPLITPDAGNPLILTDTQAALSFDTNERSESWLLFDTTSHAGASFPAGDFDPDNPAHNPYSDYLSGASSGNLSHTFVFSLDSLVPETAYYYRFISEDVSGNASAGTEASFTTLATQVDQHGPLGTISTPADANTDDSADITRGPAYAYVTWTTDSVANQSLDCSLTQGGPYTISTSDLSTYNKKHTLKLPSLAADTKYWCQATSVDDLAPANSLTSSEFSFTTLPDPEFQHDPLSEITDITDPPAVLTDTKAVVRFNTDQAALCVIEYGTGSGNYTEVPITESLYNFNHSMHLTGLIFSTSYFYQITCADNLDNSVTSAEYSFTTTEQQFTSTEWGAQGDTTAPVISGVSTSSITGESITVSWDTNEEASSSVAYGITSGTYEGMASNYLVNSDTANYVTAHSVIINGLVPATKYYYKAMSTDISGNIAESAESSFTTSSPSSLSSIKVISKNINEVTVTWETSKETTSVLEYGLTTLYGESRTNNQMSKVHEITISKLTAAQTYHLRVKGKDEDNNWFASADYTFEPKSPPQISNVKLANVTEHEAKVQFTTNVPTDALVTYTDPADNENSGSQGKPDMATNHEVELKNLTQGTTFALTIKVRDADGNETEQTAQNFTTGKDENPPKIDQVRTDSALTQNDNVQTIISWTTDEQATTSLIYKEGRNSEEKEVKISDNETLNHVAVITTFKSGVVYYFKVKSVDQSKNAGLSSEYALLTPKRKENVIQLIINNFEQIFGWAKR